MIAILDGLRLAGISHIAFAVEASGPKGPANDATNASPPTSPSTPAPAPMARKATVDQQAAPDRGSSWNCVFPPESDKTGIDSAVATVEVSVNPAGVAVGVHLLQDPGNGFGRSAMLCALGQRYVPALDAHGTPYLAVTPPINVRFMR